MKKIAFLAAGVDSHDLYSVAVYEKAS